MVIIRGFRLRIVERGIDVGWVYDWEIRWFMFWIFSNTIWFRGVDVLTSIQG